jgi:hypothetical protein
MKTDQRATTPPAQPEPLRFEEMRRQARARVDGFEHWFVLFDTASERATRQMYKRFYRNCNSDDFQVFAIDWAGQLFAVALMRKRRMMRRELAKLVRRYSPVDLTARECAGQDVLIFTAPRNLAAATELAVTILEDKPAAQKKSWLN